MDSISSTTLLPTVASGAVTGPLLLFAALGAAASAFLAAGWASYRDRKLPDAGVLFRAAIAGLLTGGAGAFWYTTGGGDSTLERIASAVRAVVAVATPVSAVAEASASTVVAVEAGGLQLREGFPSF